MKKGVGIWIFGFLTFLAVLHTFDAYLSLMSGEASLLQLYQLGYALTNIDSMIYFFGSMSVAFVFFGVTCSIACHNPIMTLYNKILADVEFVEGKVDKAAEAETGLLDMINHSLTSNSIDLHGMKKNLKSVEDSQNGLKVEMAHLTSMLGELRNGLKLSLQKLEMDLARGNKCPFCGKEIIPQFKLCPYCGDENRKASHRTACYKIKQTMKDKLIFRCVACNKSFEIFKKGDWVLKSDNLNVI